MTNTKMIDKLRAGKPVFGTFCTALEPRLFEMWGYAGLDYCIIDAEHGTFYFDQVENMVRACDCSGMSSVLRVPDCTEYSILHGLDVGCSAVQVPSLRDMNVAKFGQQFSKYYPAGIRGMCTTQRSSNYSFSFDQGYFARQNKDQVLIYQVETREMVEQIEELCKIDTFDIIFIGPGDLSQSYGKPGQMDAPEVMEAIKYVTDVGLAHGKIVGTIAMDPSGLKKFLDMGMLYMSVATDMHFYSKAMRDLGAAFDDIRKAY